MYRGSTGKAHVYNARVHTYTYTYIHIHTYMYTYIYIYMYVYIYIYIYMYVYIHIYICIEVVQGKHMYTMHMYVTWNFDDLIEIATHRNWFFSIVGCMLCSICRWGACMHSCMYSECDISMTWLTSRLTQNDVSNFLVACSVIYIGRLHYTSCWKSFRWLDWVRDSHKMMFQTSGLHVLWYV